MKNHLGNAAVAEQKLSVALVHGNRGRLFHLPPNKADREKIPAKIKWLTYFLLRKGQGLRFKVWGAGRPRYG